ncbi:MAG: SH3 domain-containing protein [Planctomycetota bacterium]
MHAKAMQRMADPFKQVREQMKAMQRMADPFKQVREQMKAMQRMADPFKQVREQMKAMQRMVDPFKQVREQMKAMQRMADPLKQMREQMKALDLRDTFRDVIVRIAQTENVGDCDVEQALEQVTCEIQEEATQFTLSLLSLEFYLSVLFSLLLFICSQRLSKQAERRIIEKITSINSVLLERVENTPYSNELYAALNTIYIVRRQVCVRQAPKSRSIIIDSLLPNQKVSLVKRNKKWIKVCYFDSSLRMHRIGWCRKKYFRRYE